MPGLLILFGLNSCLQRISGLSSASKLPSDRLDVLFRISIYLSFSIILLKGEVSVIKRLKNTSFCSSNQKLFSFQDRSENMVIEHNFLSEHRLFSLYQIRQPENRL
jgi:hypothetical protein